MRCSSRPALLLSACIAAATHAHADYSNAVFFGDSLTDAGTYRPIVESLYPGTGKFTTNPGPVWSEVLAAELGHSARPANAGGTDYAAGGARVTKNPGYPSSQFFTAAAPTISTQISSYLDSNGGRADANALYSIWAGANDLFALEAPEAFTDYAADPMPVVASQLADQIGRLQRAGARTVVVFNLPDTGATPGSIADGPEATAISTAHAVEYNRALFAELRARGLNVIPIDTFSLLRTIIADPTRFGFTDARTPACDMSQVPSSLICTSENYAPGSEQRHVFADRDHPSTAAHALISRYVLGMLAAPQQINALPVNAVATRLALHDLLRTQIAAGDTARAAGGRNVWVSVQGQRNEYDTTKLDPSDDGSGYHFALGFDVPVVEDWIVGGALSVSHTGFDYAAQRGDYAQRDTTLSIYTRWRGQAGAEGRWFAQGAASYGTQEYDVNRRVPMGITSLDADGDTRGRNLSLQVEGGYEFVAGAFAHGPYVGAVVQDVRIDGFEEKGGEAANLDYAPQKRHSIVGSAGWQLSYDAGLWAPYARIGAEHEFEDRDHTLEMRAVSIPEAGSFRVEVTDPKRTRYPLQIGIRGELRNAAGFNIGLTQNFGTDNDNSTRIFAGISARF